jgi:RNA polymerase sigma factor (TIGR02999 family)
MSELSENDAVIASTVTGLLQAWSRGEPGALERLMSAVYADLRRQAARHLRREAPGHTLQPTALVHETFIRLVGQPRVRFQNRVHFLAACSHVMRRVLVDHARRRKRLKRGGLLCRVELEAGPACGGGGQDLELLALHGALEDLQALDGEQARLVEMRFFGGLTNEEAAEALGVSPRTAKRSWRSARAFLLSRLSIRPAP